MAILATLAVAIVSGIVTGLSFNFPAVSFISWCSFAPLLYILHRGKGCSAAWSGIFFGVSFYLTILFWISHVTFLGLVVLVAYLTIYPAIFFLVARYFLEKPFSLLTLPAFWVILEFVKENIWCGFSWGNLGYSQYRATSFIQVADILGVKGISFFMIMVNTFIATAITCRKNFIRKAVIVSLFLISCLLYGEYVLSTIHAYAKANVTVVQPNVPQTLKWSDKHMLEIKKILKSLGDRTDKDSLVIFPESAWPEVFDQNKEMSILETFVKDLQRDVLIGAVLYDKGSFYNTALQFDCTGNVKRIYRKIRLVPFGEYIPLRRWLSFIPVINMIGDMSRGSEYTTFLYGDKEFATLICFEDIFPAHVRTFSKKSDFLVNITNDAWFKGEPEASQHFAIMVLRAIENRISIVRCANTGISGWVSFTGKMERYKENGSDILFAGVKKMSIAINDKKSFYNHYGEVFPLGCAFILLIFVFCSTKRCCSNTKS